MTAARNPFEPVPPRNGDLGRLVTVGHLAPDWACRWCAQPLTPTAGAGLICTRCDTPEDQ